MTSDRLRSGTGDEIGIGSGHTYEDTVRKVRGVAHLRYCPHSCFAFTALEVFPFFRWVRCPMCDICLRFLLQHPPAVAARSRSGAPTSEMRHPNEDTVRKVRDVARLRYRPLLLRLHHPRSIPFFSAG